MNIVLCGLPGCGKGTASDQIVKDYLLTPIVAGDLLRKEKNSKSELGIKISSLIDKGNLVPDEVITELIRKELSNLKSDCLMDGYPRTTKQAKDLDSMINVDLVIYFNVDDSIVIDRIEKRGKTSGRADDQSIEITKQRLNNYYKDTQPLIEYYKSVDKLFVVDASKSIDDVYKQIKYILNAFK